MIAKILTLLFVVSCASFNKERVIEMDSIDTLRFETLNRYDKSRLSEIKNKVVGIDKNLVMCHLGETKESLKDLSDKLDSFFQDAKYWNAVAVCHIVQEDYNKAKFFIDKGLASKFTDKRTKASLLNNLGLIYLKGEMLHEANNQFEMSLKEEKLLTTQYNLISIYLEFGMIEKAKDAIFPLFDRNPKDSDLIFAMGSYYLQTGKYQLALSFFQRLGKDSHKRNDIANAIAICHFQLGDYKKAMDAVKARNKNLTETKLSSVSIELEKMINNKLKEAR